MRHYKFRHLMTDQQLVAMSKAGAMAREIIRQANAEPRFSVIPAGLQIANIMIDMRYGQERFYHALFFQHKMHHNRYRLILNNKEWPRLIGWDDGSRIVADCIRPIPKAFTE